jgi:hypothetical protein
MARLESGDTVGLQIQLQAQKDHFCFSVEITEQAVTFGQQSYARNEQEKYLREASKCAPEPLSEITRKQQEINC